MSILFDIELTILDGSTIDGYQVDYHDKKDSLASPNPK